MEHRGGKEGGRKWRTHLSETILRDCVSEELTTFLDVSSQKEAINTLVELLNDRGKLLDKEEFLRAIMKRESVVSTGIGVGIAIPHAKIKGYKDFFVAIGIQQKKHGIDWHALDGIAVRAIFMIGGPDDRQADYLHLLSMITTSMKDDLLRKKLFTAKNVQEVIALFPDHRDLAGS